MMKVNIIPAFIMTLFIAGAYNGTYTYAAERKVRTYEEQQLHGWGHLANYLAKEKVSDKKIQKLFYDKRMPRFTKLSFAVAPKESKRLYKNFDSKKNIASAKKYLTKYQSSFSNAEKQFQIDRSLIASILLIETHFGSYTGNHRIIYRLARLANAGSPTNVQKNYKRLRKSGEMVTFEEVQNRAQYLEDIFAPQVLAALQVAEKRKLDVFLIRGSSSGAFGIPQFLPKSYLDYGVDGNRDGTLSLFQHTDAIYSVGSFLGHYKKIHGNNIEKAIWEYNRSDAYVDAVIRTAKKLGLPPEPKQQKVALLDRS